MKITPMNQAEDLLSTQCDLAIRLNVVTHLDEGLRLCLETAIKVSEMDCGGVYLVDDSSGALDLVFHKGLSSEFVKDVCHFDVDTPNTKRVMEGKSAYTQRKNLEVPLETAERHEELLGFAVLPVRHNNQVIGCINIASHKLEEVPMLCRPALEAISAQMGGTIARLRSEEALRESEEHLRSFMESAKAFIVYRLEVDPENYFSGRLVFVSSGIQDLIGVSPEAEFSEWFNNVHPDDLPGLIEAQAKSVRNGDTFDQEFRWKSIKGEWGWCHAISNPVFDSEGKPKYYNGMIIDVTPRKQAEKALQESEGHLRSLMESASNFAVYRLMSDGDNPNLLRAIFVSPSITDIMGVSEPMSFETWFEHIHPDDVERIVEANIEAFKTNRFDETMRIYHPQEQKWVWIHAISTGFEDHERQCKYVNGILIDITRQKKSERALWESEQRMGLAMEGGNIGLWDWNLRTGEVFFDRRWHESLGYSPGDVELNSRTWEKIIHPEDWPGVQQTQKDSLSGKIPFYEKEARLKCKSGQWRWMLARAKIMERDSNGKALRMIGTYQDINDRKLMEIELQIKTLELEETNTALKVLLNHREKDKEELGEKVLSNVKSLVEPYLKELKDSRVDQRQIVFLGLLESGLKNILSSFSSKLSSKYLGLTPGELQVAYLIKEGKRTKEIAELLNLSGKTIEDYRKRLRKKLGIRNMKVNLRTHLLSIQK